MYVEYFLLSSMIGLSWLVGVSGAPVSDGSADVISLWFIVLRSLACRHAESLILLV